MIISAETIESGVVIDADLCVVGAGPAGLTLARHFIGTQHRVYILESGDERIDERARELADGDSVGHPYFPLADAVGYAVGGSSHLWEEWMRARPLDPIDFSARPWVPESGWPVGLEELLPFYQQAHPDLGLGPFDYNIHESDRPDSSGCVAPALFRYSNTFDFERLRRQIDASSNVCLVVRASALELMPDPDGRRIGRLTASTENPQRFHVDARHYVLAAGGLGNPRLLLLSGNPSKRGLANSSGLVGGYFMEHPMIRRGVIVPSDSLTGSNWEIFRMSTSSPSTRAALVPTETTMREAEILNGMVLLSESDDIRASESVRSLAIVRDALQGENSSGESALKHVLSLARRPKDLINVARVRFGSKPAKRRIQMSITVEQAPSRASRVSLGSRIDRFGRPLPVLDWRLGELERRTVRVLQERVDQYVRARGIGHVEGFIGEEWPPRTFRGEWHQLGTTRMSASPRQGVVDAKGKSHDFDNLHIAGGSVFPTVGYANPTLTIVALSLRLAQKLELVLARGVSLGPIW